MKQNFSHLSIKKLFYIGKDIFLWCLKYLLYFFSISVAQCKYDHHLVKDSTVIALNKFKSPEIYSTLVLKVQNKPSSNIYFENLFNYNDIDWTAIYKLPRLVTHDTYMRSFQYKVLNNVLYLNNKAISSYFWNKVISSVFFL